MVDPSSNTNAGPNANPYENCVRKSSILIMLFGSALSEPLIRHFDARSFKILFLGEEAEAASLICLLHAAIQGNAAEAELYGVAKNYLAQASSQCKGRFR